MFSLVWKDLLLSKKIMPFILIYGLFMIFLFSRSLSVPAAAYVASTVAISYMFITRAAAYDEVNKAEVILLSLPISRAKIVYGKYLSVFVFAILGSLSYALGTVIIKLFNLPLEIAPITLGSIISMVVALTFMVSIYFPLYFKMGYLKSKIINMFLFLAVFFVPANLIVFIRSRKYSWLNESIDYLSKLPDYVVLTYFLAAAMLLLVGSLVLSLYFYKNRDF